MSQGYIRPLRPREAGEVLAFLVTCLISGLRAGFPGPVQQVAFSDHVSYILYGGRWFES